MPVTVTYYGPDGVPGGGDDIVFNTITDATGGYLVDGLPLGNYNVTITPPDSFPTATFDSDGGNDNTTNVTLTAGIPDNLDQDFGLQGNSALGNYVWNDLNANAIQDDGATGIAGATVTLYFDANNDGLINGAEASTPVATTLTNATGFYSFPNLAAGVYQGGFVTPAGYDAASEPGNGTAATDSDADPVTGLSPLVTLPLNTTNHYR